MKNFYNKVIKNLLILSLFSCSVGVRGETKWEDYFLSFSLKKTDKKEVEEIFKFPLYEDNSLHYFLLTISNKEKKEMLYESNRLFSIDILIDYYIRKIAKNEDFSSGKIVEYLGKEYRSNHVPLKTLIVYSKNDSEVFVAKLNNSQYPKLNSYSRSQLYEKKDFDEFNEKSISECHQKLRMEIEQLFKKKYPDGIPEKEKNLMNKDIYYGFRFCLPWIK